MDAWNARKDRLDALAEQRALVNLSDARIGRWTLTDSATGLNGNMGLKDG